MNPQHKEYVGLVNRQIKELTGIYRDAVKHLDVSDSEFWIWYTLVSTDESYTQQDICNMWSLPKQTVNSIITHLRLKKFAYLEAIPGTRNHKIIRLTDLGRAFGEKLIAPIIRVEETAFYGLSAQELKTVTEIFSRYMNALREGLHKIEQTSTPSPSGIRAQEVS
jgi:DNA-binding MarR family transcriptional regulator